MTRLSRQSYVWLVTASLGGLAYLASSAAGASPVHPPVGVPWPLVAAAFAAADLLMVRFEFRDQAHGLNLQEVPLVVGLVFCSPLGLILARLTATLVSMGVKRRQPPIKLAFNLAQQALRVAVAELLAFHLLAGHSAVSPWGWMGLVAAATASLLIGDGSILVVIWITAGRLQASTLSELFLAAPPVLATSMTIGLICALVLWVNMWAAWMLVLAAGGAAIVHQLHHRLRRRYANLELLYAFTADVAAVRPSPELTGRILAQARTIMHAERASLLMAVDDGYERDVLDAAGLRTEGARAPGQLEQRVLGAGRGLVAYRNAGGGVVEAMAADGVRDAVLAPISGDQGGAAGVLAVWDRLGSEMTSFDEAELRLFEALAQAAGVALRRGQLVEELQTEAAEKEYQANHDLLTGLPNRAHFSARLETATRERVSGSRLAVLLMDLDDFKEINDTLGHDVGDAVLARVGNRLAEVIGSEGLVTRMGGDEFGVLLSTEPTDGFVPLVQRALAAVAEPFTVEEMVLQVGASVGLVVCPDHGEKPSVLVQRADVAMYTAKENKTGWAEYKPDLDHYSPRRLSLVGDLRQALRFEGDGAGSLELFYQPKVELMTREVTGVEALLRWRHPSHGMVPPDEFIPLAEHSGVIGPLTSWVLEQALVQQSHWTARGLQLSMAVNLSVRSLTDSGLVEEVASRLRDAGVLPGRLTLEITESSVMADANRSIAVLTQLSALGVRLSIDDFGTGYSSLSRLTKMPVDEVKIDKSLVFNMLHDTGDLAIVQTTIDLARNLNLEMVAEGVEDELTWERLRALGCDAAQGYFLTRPVPAPALEAWLASWRAQASAAAVPSRVVAFRH